MVEVADAEARARLSHYLRLAESGKRVVILRRGAPVAEIVAYRPPVDRDLRASAFGMFSFSMTDEELDEALRPMTDEEADAFIEGR